MATYRVIVTRDTTESVAITVDAEDATIAQEVARDVSYDEAQLAAQGVTWEQDDTPSASATHYTNGAELIGGAA